MAYRYSTINTVRTDNGSGKTHYVNTVYPDIPYSDQDQYVITTIGDRLDLIANDIYGDPSFWWILASANNLPGDSLVPPIGHQLRIPTNTQQIINDYESVNRIR